MLYLYAGTNGFCLGLIGEVKGDLKSHPISYIDTLLRYHLHIDPDKLSDEEWAVTFAQLEDIRKQERKESE
mgnify:CR=1 FL=1